MTINITPEIIKAAEILGNGGLVAFPTETVYGLGADASNEAAVRRVFLAKERPYNHPLIVHIARLEQLSDWARQIPPSALKLAEAFWPGPLTMVLKRQPQVLDIVTGGQDTVGLRMPRHPVAQALLQAFGGGVVAPSANKFTHISPTTSSAVREELGAEVDMSLEGGSCEVGLESTIIDLSGDKPIILRPGMITVDEIAAVLGVDIASAQTASTTARAPGMHHLHYAPTTRTVLVNADQIAASIQSAEQPVAVLLRSQITLPPSANVHVVQMPQSTAAYAHDLYQTLRALDHQQYKCIMIESVPESVEWSAIRDRLNKATAER